MATEEKSDKSSKKSKTAPTEPKEEKSPEAGVAKGKGPPKDSAKDSAKSEAAPATAAALLNPLADEPKAKIAKAKGSKNIASGIAHVVASFNNTLISITDQRGNLIAWSSAGKAGFKGSRKSTAYAAQMAAQDCGRQAMSHGMKEVEVLVKGPGLGRESAVRSLQAIGLEVTSIRDATPAPHNGCRPRKPRRV